MCEVILRLLGLPNTTDGTLTPLPRYKYVFKEEVHQLFFSDAEGVPYAKELPNTAHPAFCLGQGEVFLLENSSVGIAL